MDEDRQLEQPEAQPAPPRRRSRRWLYLLTVPVLLAAAYVLLRAPQLEPISRRQLPAGRGVMPSRGGYPAIEVGISPLVPGWAYTFTQAPARILDDRCMPVFELRPFPLMAMRSPTGKYLAWVDRAHHAGMDTVVLRPLRADGRASWFPLPVSAFPVMPVTVSDTGIAVISNRQVYGTKGPLNCTFPDTYHPCAISHPDSRYLLLSDPVKSLLAIYDIADQRIIFSQHTSPLPDGFHTQLFTTGKRLLILPYTGVAYVVAGGKRLATLGTAKTIWYWGEDGTIWTVNGRNLRIVHWQQGTPRLVDAGELPAPDSHFGSQVAVCDGGRVRAVAETRNIMPEEVAKGCRRVADRIGLQKTIPFEQRQLTLYRDGKRIGCFGVRLKPLWNVHVPKRFTLPPPFPQVISPMYMERIAFSGDGRYLSWVIDPGTGRQQVYCFKVP